MDEILIQYFNGTLSSTQEDELFKALEQDPVLRADFLALKKTRYITASVMEEHGDEAFAKAQWKQFKSMTSTSRRFRVLRAAIWAAAALMVLGVGLWSWQHSASTIDPVIPVSQPYAPIAMLEVTVPQGQYTHLELPDGTKVWLNSHSTLRYPQRFSETERQVELKGEAYFEVTHNPEAPFTVNTDQYDIQVLGTHFNVFAYEDAPFRTSLSEGSVRIVPTSEKGRSITLKPSQYATSNGNRLNTGRFEDEDFLAWKDGLYCFNNEPLSQILVRLQAYYNTPVIVEDADLRSKHFSGKFRPTDGLENILKALQNAGDFQMATQSEPHRIIINKKPADADTSTGK